MNFEKQQSFATFKNFKKISTNFIFAVFTLHHTQNKAMIRAYYVIISTCNSSSQTSALTVTLCDNTGERQLKSLVCIIMTVRVRKS